MVYYIKPITDISSTYPVEVDGDGRVDFYYFDGYDDQSSFELTIPELRRILEQAERHHNAYVAYKKADFDEDVYKREMAER